MPLEINEIGIRMRVSSGAGAENRRPETRSDNHCNLDRDEIVEDCVRRVLQIVNSSRER